VSQSTPLRPRGESPEFIRKLRDQTVEENETAQFVCLVLGNPEPTFKWFKDDLEINESEKYKLTYLEDKLTLDVLNCTADDEGMYKCEAENQCGNDMTMARLIVEGNTLIIFVRLSNDFLSFCLFVCFLFASLFVSLFDCLFVCCLFCLFLCLIVCCLLVCLFVSLFVCLFLLVLLV